MPTIWSQNILEKVLRSVLLQGHTIEILWKHYSKVYKNSTMEATIGATFSMQIELFKTYNLITKYPGKSTALGNFTGTHHANFMKTL